MGSWRVPRLRRWIGAIALPLSTLACAAAPAVPTGVGSEIYLQGHLPGGQPLRGEREAGVRVEGQEAACSTCHRRSGLGSTEGRIVVPPIIGPYLLRPHATNVQDMSLPHVPGYRSTRIPYTPETLARAIREGVDPSGRSLNYLMPRYAIDDVSMKSLIQYLQAMRDEPVPGVSDDALHFATIITPDADPVQRQAMLEVMTKFFEDKNAFQRGGARRLQAAREIDYRVTRRWQLHVWELRGAADTWEAQLEAKLLAEPVFAVISGLAGRTWAPVHRFCERAALPCLFPNTELPVVAEDDFYSVYFSRGVLLEADLMMEALVGWKQARATTGRVLQIVREGDVGVEAAATLAREATALGLKVETSTLAATVTGRGDVTAAMVNVGANDAVVLWLRADDIAALPVSATASELVLMSGAMAGAEFAPVPQSWRERMLMTYATDLPSLRKVRMNYPLGWFKVRKVSVVAERVQTDTYIACGILAETLSDMLDSFVREYLVERVETMVSHRLSNGYYPRLGLAPGQRFASKGGYLVRFADPQGARLAAVGEWTVP